ncbi:MAG: SAF domain-containing protein [Candidatus Obscuribacterales bacterium]
MSSKNKSSITIPIVVLCIKAVMIAGMMWSVEKTGTPVVVARREIPAHTIIDKSMVDQTYMMTDIYHDGARSLASVVGHVSTCDIPRQAQIRTVDFQ